MYRKIAVVGLLICLLLTGIPYSSASAEESPAVQGQHYTTAFTGVDTAMTGVSAWKQEVFDVADYWTVKQVQIELDYQASPLTKGDQSSVTLLLNGTPFHSFRPVISTGAKQHLSLTVPAGLVKKGNNTLMIQGRILSTDTTDGIQICTPINDNDNWLQLYKTSLVNVYYDTQPMKDSIRDFNNRFIGLDTIANSRSAVTVPKDSDPSELEAAVYALSGFAKANPLSDKNIPLLADGLDETKDKQAIVAVALYDRLPAALKSLVGTRDLSKQALIQLVHVNTQPTLVVTSSNPELLVKAGRLAGNQDLLNQLDGNAKLVDANTEVALPHADITKTVALSESGDKLVGAEHQERAYYIALPANRSLAEASKLSLDFRYAQNLDFDRSLVTVLVNDKPIGSKRLTSELADGDTINLTIPKNLNISGNFTVTVAFDLELKNITCAQNPDQMPWAFIDKASMLQLNTKDRTDLLFNNYPYPFLRDGIYNQVGVVLPKEQNSYMYRAISNVFNLLGQYAESNTGEVKFYADNTSADTLKNRNLIVIGTYQDNQVIRDQNKQLYFQYQTDGSGFKSNEKMSIDADYGKRLGTLQLIVSPYEAGHGFMAITGASSAYYNLASKLIASQSTMWKVSGDAVTADQDGNIQAFRFKLEKNTQPSTVISDVLDRTDVLTFMVSIVLVLVLVLLSLILMIRKHRKKRRGTR